MAYREGDVISYAVPTAARYCPVLDRTRSPDEFGQPLRTAYKLLARTHALSFSAAYQTDEVPSVQLGYEYAVTTHDPLQYENHLWKRTSPWRIEMRPSRGFVLAYCLALAGDLLAGSLEVIVKDDKGRPCSDAVAYAAAAAAASAAPKKHAVVDQRDKQFFPYVTAYSGHRGHFPEQR